MTDDLSSSCQKRYRRKSYKTIGVIPPYSIQTENELFMESNFYNTKFTTHQISMI